MYFSRQGSRAILWLPASGPVLFEVIGVPVGFGFMEDVFEFVLSNAIFAMVLVGNLDLSPVVNFDVGMIGSGFDACAII